VSHSVREIELEETSGAVVKVPTGLLCRAPQAWFADVPPYPREPRDVPYRGHGSTQQAALADGLRVREAAAEHARP
jgi:hypothetical protein